MMGFPYIPLFDQRPAERPAVTAMYLHTACSSCAAMRTKGHTRFVSVHRGFIVTGRL